MGALFSKGETKIRPGLYRRNESTSSSAVAGADDGVVAVVMSAGWGVLGEVTTHETVTSVKTMYGDAATVDAALLAFEGGAKEVKIIRVGTGGSKGTMDLGGVTLAAKYEGDLALSVTVREKLGDATAKEMVVYKGTAVLETILFASGDGEAANLAEAVNTNSLYFTATSKDGEVTSVSQKAITPGTAPNVTNEDYSKAFDKMEAIRFNCLIVDTNAVDVHAMVHAFIERIYETGGLAQGFVGEPITVAFDTRKAHAAAFNDNKVVYIGGSYKTSDEKLVDGYKAAAIVAGSVAATPSSASIVHKAVPGAVELAEKLTNSQYIEAIKNGMILFSEGSNGEIWIDSGVNTLVNLEADQDEGWKKIKRTKIRFELMDRIDRTVAPVIGKINCNSDGIANVVKLGQDVINAMIAEGKLMPGGTFIEDPDNPHKGDSAWFLIAVDDIDSLEKIYMTYQFRFSSV